MTPVGAVRVRRYDEERYCVQKNYERLGWVTLDRLFWIQHDGEREAFEYALELSREEQ